MDSKTFAIGMHMLETSFGVQTKEKLSMMYQTLKDDFENIEFQQCVKYILKKWKPVFYNAFPSIAEFYEYKNMKLSIKAEAIIDFIRSNWWVTDINKTIDLKDGALHATIRRFGRREIGQDDFWKYNRKEFIQTYVKKSLMKDYDFKPLRGIVDVPEVIECDCKAQINKAVQNKLISQ